MNHNPILTFQKDRMVNISVNSGTATLGFETVFGLRSEATLHAVEALSMSDFKQANIVVNFAVLDGEDTVTAYAEELLKQLFPEPKTAASEKAHETHRTLMVSRNARLRSREAVLVSVSMAYGANLVAMCATISENIVSS